MHYSNLVIIENDYDVDSSVQRAMGKSAYDDPRSFWDWYQIGGRWTGVLDGDSYDPASDPQNKDKWPTDWARYAGDVQPIENVTPEAYDRFFRVVVEDGPIYGGEEYLPWKSFSEGCFVRREMPPLEWLQDQYRGRWVVVVDNHD